MTIAIYYELDLIIKFCVCQNSIGYFWIFNILNQMIVGVQFASLSHSVVIMACSEFDLLGYECGALIIDNSIKAFARLMSFELNIRYMNYNSSQVYINICCYQKIRIFYLTIEL